MMKAVTAHGLGWGRANGLAGPCISAVLLTADLACSSGSLSSGISPVAFTQSVIEAVGQVGAQCLLFLRA